MNTNTIIWAQLFEYSNNLNIHGNTEANLYTFREQWLYIRVCLCTLYYRSFWGEHPTEPNLTQTSCHLIRPDFVLLDMLPWVYIFVSFQTYSFCSK